MIPGMRQKEQKERKAMDHSIFPAVICVPRWSLQSQSYAVLHMHPIPAAAVPLPTEHGVHRTKSVHTLLLDVHPGTWNIFPEQYQVHFCGLSRPLHSPDYSKYMWPWMARIAVWKCRKKRGRLGCTYGLWASTYALVPAQKCKKGGDGHNFLIF